MDEPDFSSSLLDLQARMSELDVDKKKAPPIFYVSDNEADKIVDKITLVVQESTEEIDDGEAVEEESKTKGSVEAGLLDSQCRGCGVEVKLLLRHLNSKPGKKCKENYKEEELEGHKKAVGRRKRATYRTNSKIKISVSNAKYHQKTRPAVLEKMAKYNEVNKDKQAKARKKKREDMTMWDCKKAFWAETAWGAIYPCLCCHKTFFRNGVRKANPKEMNKKYRFFEKSVDMTVIHAGPNKFFIKDYYWMCHGCFDKIKGNSMPATSVMNANKIYDLPDCLRNLTEVENVLLAPRIAFMKMIRLPVSRMSGIRDRIVNVPIPNKTIEKTVASLPRSLPRTLEEAQVIPISLRKKRDLVTSHIEQWIDPERVIESYW